LREKREKLREKRESEKKAEMGNGARDGRECQTFLLLRVVALCPLHLVALSSLRCPK
jgi:hypothetical protein